MEQFDDSDIREFLFFYDVPGPAPDLVERTKHLMYQELLQEETVPVIQDRGVFVVVALSIAMTLCMFYMLTVGTILRYVLPGDLAVFFRHTFYMLSASGGCILACSLMMLIFKHISGSRPVESFGRINC